MSYQIERLKENLYRADISKSSISALIKIISKKYIWKQVYLISEVFYDQVKEIDDFLLNKKKTYEFRRKPFPLFIIDIGKENNNIDLSVLRYFWGTDLPAVDNIYIILLYKGTSIDNIISLLEKDGNINPKKFLNLGNECVIIQNESDGILCLIYSNEVGFLDNQK